MPQDGGHVGGGHGAVGRQGGQRLLVGVDQELAAQPLGRGPGQQRRQRGLEGFLPPSVGLGVEVVRRRRRGTQGRDYCLECFLGEVLAHREIPPQRVRMGIDPPRILSHI
ncbi:hypothetical protein ACZ91_41185 [Streptomyces regensis]|nr:hypothetical protein ACZ91_41185 [Streptomyces regensis]